MMMTQYRRRHSSTPTVPLWLYALAVLVGLLNSIAHDQFCRALLQPTTAITTRRISSRTPTYAQSFGTTTTTTVTHKFSRLSAVNKKDDNEREQIENARLGIWKSRRSQIRQMLKSAESLKNFRIEQGFVPEIDEETGKPIKGGDSKAAVTLTAFAVAAGAIILRVGGRAALVSAVGLDFLTDNPELRQQVETVLQQAETVDPAVKAGLFCLAWTAVKVLCVDAAGVVLALSSGILFGGVLQGTIMSALAATIGSSVAFGIAKADTPFRKKALEIVEENPSLRGIDKVVTEDGLKAVLTLRLCPILPIPLGAYNYVYGTTNVRYFDFAGGIFLGSLKPYLLDAYLGYFGKTLVDGTASQEGGLQDYALVVALGVSVLVGVFASQLASETWDAVLEEQEAEEKARKVKEAENGGDDNADDDEVMTALFGVELPQWVVKFQYALKDAEDRMTDLILQEFDARVWNETEEFKFFGMYTVQEQTLSDERNPAMINPNSPEITQKYQDIDFGASTCDGLVLSPLLLSFFLQFSDPLFDEEKFEQERILDGKGRDKISPGLVPIAPLQMPVSELQKSVAMVSLLSTLSSIDQRKPMAVDDDKGSNNGSNDIDDRSSKSDNTSSLEVRRGNLLNQLQVLRDETTQRLQDLDRKLEKLDKS